MPNMKRFDRRGSGPWFYLAIAVILFGLYSLAIAATTADKCDGYAGRSWQVAPPHWECKAQPGFG